MKPRAGKDIPEDAGSWDARLRASDCSDEERMAFRMWRQSSVQNQREYDWLQNLLADICASRSAPEIRSLREWAFESSSDRPKLLLRRRPAVWAGAIAAMAALLIAGPWLFGLGSGDRARQSDSASPKLMTAIGERSTFSLDDGTTIVLNTNTRLALDFSGKERRVTLFQGQALFDVAKDSDSPFVVRAGDQRIVAVGTLFDVQLEGAEVHVTLVEGIVEVALADDDETHGAPAPVRLLAGQRLTTTTESASIPSIIESIDIEQATIWQTGRVFFEDTLLSDAIDEMNRYSTLKIAIEDESLGKIRVSGMFQSGRQANFVNALEAYFPVTAVRMNDNLIVLRAN